MPPREYSFTRYLSAKVSVDDRALNRQVWRTLANSLPATSAENPLRVLEIGAGIGTMLERMLDWKLLQYADYTAIDAQPENIAHAQRRLEKRSDHGIEDVINQKGSLVLRGKHHLVNVNLHPLDLFDFLPRQIGARTWDLLVANAFLDLIDLPTKLPKILSLLSPGGLFYFTINFDGVTIFEPQIDPLLDDKILALYHRTMDERFIKGQPSGDSHTGRHLFTQLRNAGAEILAAGASDWVVFPISGSYPNDEAYFLHFIIHTLQQALLGHPELEATNLKSWVDTRHAQIENNELVYIAHQIDFFGRTPL